MGFKNSAIIDYPIEDVFKVFIRTAKRDFPKFDIKNPIGVSVTKKVGAYSAKEAMMNIEITDFKMNELYQITSVKDSLAYVSTYTFEEISDNETRISLEETENSPGFMAGLNVIIQNICFRGTSKKRFGYFISGLESSIEEYNKMVSRSKPKKDIDKSNEDDGIRIIEK